MTAMRFATMEARDEFLNIQYPAREPTLTPGVYIVPGGLLDVTLNTIHVYETLEAGYAAV